MVLGGGGASAAVLPRSGTPRAAFDRLNSADRQPFEATPTLTFGAFAGGSGVDPEARRRTIAERPDTDAWPWSDPRVPAPARSTRRRRVFTAEDGAPPADVILAGSAVRRQGEAIAADVRKHRDAQPSADR